MNTDPNAIKVLCFGDSNTWGQKPDKTGRYPANVRWTGKLQDSLGDGYYIVEEGLGSRTTDLNYERKPGRNGKTYLQPCLESHSPLDVVLIMLGTNDLKLEYSRTAQDIAKALEGLVRMVREYGRDKNGNPPNIMLVSPILVDINAPRFTEFYTGYYDENAATQSKQLAGAIKEVAEKTGCRFVDAATVAKSGEDGLHFSEESHPTLGELLAKEIQS
jgi:lysophospholipase L1-like esterase